jgi:hypothetical protein
MVRGARGLYERDGRTALLVLSNSVVPSNALEARADFQHTEKAHRRPNAVVAYSKRARLGFDTASQDRCDRLVIGWFRGESLTLRAPQRW